jgi:hypothetical protein
MIRWLILFLEYDFTVVYKLGKIHVIANALLRLPNITEPARVLDQTTSASLFYTWLKWMNDENNF